MSRSKVIFQTLLMLLLVGFGVAVGWWLGPGSGDSAAATHDDPHAGHDHSAHGASGASATSEDKHVPLSREAVLNLGLETGPIKLANHARHISIPGTVISNPTDGHRTIAAPVTGVVRKIAASTGTAVAPASTLFAIDITDQELMNTQTEVLHAMSRLKILVREVDRLEPLLQQGVVGGTKLRTAKYERDQLLAKLATLQQTLNSYGFGPAELAILAKQQRLVRSVVVHAMKNDNETTSKDNQDPTALPAPPQQTKPLLRLETTGYLPAAVQTVHAAYETPASQDLPDTTDAKSAERLPIEEIYVQVGQTVQRGDKLCTLGNYSVLLVEGSAFNKDLTMLSDLLANDGTVTVRFGHQSSGAHGHEHERDNLEILYIDGEVDSETQTVKFYVQLNNEVIHRKPSADGGEYLTWLFRPGQKVHIRVPVESWQNVLRVPRVAVVKQGPNAFVFRRIGGSMEDSMTGDANDHGDHSGHDHDDDHHPDHASDDHDDHAGHDHDGDGHPDHAADDHPSHAHGEDIFVEFEPVPVHVLHQDEEFAVIASDGEMKPGQIIALNNAYQLLLASQMDSSEGGGHDHGHDH